MNISDDTTLVITRFFAAPAARVFDAWFERMQWQAWIGPEGMDCQILQLDAHVGGTYRISMKMSDGQTVPVAGVFKTIERPNLLQFTWGWDGDPARQSLITLTFADKNDGTEMTLRQEGLESTVSRDGHGKGWNSALNKLESYLAQAVNT